MSVLIKGMEMPKYCAECAAVNDDECECPFTGDSCEDYFGGRNRNCPLVHVPLHGRLIDADVLREDWLENGENEYVYDTNAFLGSLDNAPTIIPADEDEPNMDEAMAEFAQYCEMYEPTYDPETGAM